MTADPKILKGPPSFDAVEAPSRDKTIGIKNTDKKIQRSYWYIGIKNEIRCGKTKNSSDVESNVDVNAHSQTIEEDTACLPFSEEIARMDYILFFLIKRLRITHILHISVEIV